MPDSTAPHYRLIPYGLAVFSDIRKENQLYIDKTRFLHELEKYRFAFLICPRRFGKPCWLGMMENYYDRNRADQFEELFAGLDIGQSPTQVHNRYVVLRLDFDVGQSSAQR